MVESSIGSLFRSLEIVSEGCFDGHGGFDGVVVGFIEKFGAWNLFDGGSGMPGAGAGVG